jgi:ATP-dependent Clp protease ATP-binding subunit ClpC
MLPLTERAKNVIEFARREAADLRHDHVGTEHVLLGILREGGGIATRLSARLGARVEPIRKGISMLNPVSAHAGVGEAQLPFSDRLRKALRAAEETARRMGHEGVGIGHVFLGLLEDEQGKAALFLINLGLSLQATRQEVLESMSAKGR